MTIGAKVKAAAGPVLKTVPNVPLVSTGTYALGGNPYPGGETTFTSDDLADAVAAVEDAAVNLPRLKLGHTSDWGDAEPAFGKVDNLRIGDNGQTIYGDYVGVPGWLAEVLPAVYPSRSIEAMFNVETATGKEWRMVITAVSLLGVTLPGVATLDDLAGLYSEVMPEGVEVEASKTVTAKMEGDEMGLRRRKAKASLALEDVRRLYYEGLAGDQSWWWIRAVYLDPNELIVDDDEGGLYRVPFTINGEDVEFGEATEVKIQYVNAGADEDDTAGREAAEVVFASRAESRPESNEQEDDMDLKEIRERLGLPEDASDEDILAALPERSEESESEEAPSEESGEESGDEQPSAEEEAAEPVAASAPGTVTMDAAEVAQLKAQAAAGASAAERQAREDRDRLIEAAVSDGKFPPARKEHWQKLYDKDPEGTKAAIASLESGLVPVAEAGGAPGEDQAQDAYPAHWLPEVQARSNGDQRVMKETV